MGQAQTGHRLRKFRKSRGVTQAELAQEMGWAHESSVSRRERGAIPMDEEELAGIVHAVTKIVKRRQDEYTPAEVLSE